MPVLQGGLGPWSRASPGNLVRRFQGGPQGIVVESVALVPGITLPVPNPHQALVMQVVVAEHVVQRPHRHVPGGDNLPYLGRSMCVLPASSHRWPPGIETQD